MEAITYRRANAEPDDGHVHLGDESPLGLVQGLCGVTISSTDAARSHAASCRTCIARAGGPLADASFAEAVAIVAASLAADASPLQAQDFGWDLTDAGAWVVTGLHPDRDVIPGADHFVVDKRSGRITGHVAPLEVGLGRLDAYPRVSANAG